MKSERLFLPTFLLAFFLGNIGAHRFYTGKWGTGFLMLITFGGFGIWYMVDLILLITGNFRDKWGYMVVPEI